MGKPQIVHLGYDTTKWWLTVLPPATHRVANPRPGSHEPTHSSFFLPLGSTHRRFHSLLSSTVLQRDCPTHFFLVLQDDSPLLLYLPVSSSFYGSVGLTDLYSFSVSVGWQPCTLLLFLFSDSPVLLLRICRVKALYSSMFYVLWQSCTLHLVLQDDRRLLLVLLSPTLSQTHKCGNWDWGRAIPFLEIFVSNFRYCVFADCILSRMQSSSAPHESLEKAWMIMQSLPSSLKKSNQSLYKRRGFSIARPRTFA